VGSVSRALLLLTLLSGCAGQPRPFDVTTAGGGRAPSAGEAAPPFTLPDHDGNSVSLADFRGRWVVLYFHPSDDTTGCGAEGSEFTALLGRFQDAGAPVLAVGTEPPLRHRFFRTTRGVQIPLLSDVDRRTMKQYGAWREVRWRGESFGRLVRTTLLIDPSGRVAWRWDHVIPQGHPDQVRRKLEQLSSHQATASNVPLPAQEGTGKE